MIHNKGFLRSSTWLLADWSILLGTCRQVLYGIGSVTLHVGGVHVVGAHLHTAGLPVERMAVEALRIPLHLHYRPAFLLHPFPG